MTQRNKIVHFREDSGVLFKKRLTIRKKRMVPKKNSESFFFFFSFLPDIISNNTICSSLNLSHIKRSNQIKLDGGTFDSFACLYCSSQDMTWLRPQ